MKFEEVLPALREGKKIRKRKEVNEGDYYIKNKKGIIHVYSDYGKIRTCFTYGDIMNEDWEIVTEKKRVKLRDLTEEQYVKWRKNNCCANLCASSCPFKYINCCTAWRYHKEMYSDKFLDQEIEVEEWLKLNMNIYLSQ